MPLHPDWMDIALRLACTFVACGLIGLDRSSPKRAAGLRTNIMVGLAACIAMISANLMLTLDGKSPDSFVQTDVMRLPLGILTGVGFIGAGAVLRRGGLTLGVTTAASLWYVTVLGLCFGAGQFELGALGLALGLLTLLGLKYLEDAMRREHPVKLGLVLGRDGPSEASVRALLAKDAMRVRQYSLRIEPVSGQRELHYRLWWSARSVHDLPPMLEVLSAKPGVLQLDWEA
ncbi:MgtC/SapB family protein [Xanthobacter sp. VTT E-85241]|uniref:MgtC/SapB family protein n=1 Tax=Roseixanthobacter finlandensis TaxID=3119922 RepID=UPI00372A47D6